MNERMKTLRKQVEVSRAAHGVGWPASATKDRLSEGFWAEHDRAAAPLPRTSRGELIACAILLAAFALIFLIIPALRGAGYV